MSGLEIAIPVITAVAALIAAYKDGNKILARIKKKRAQKGKLQPSDELERALEQGQTSITRLRDEGSEVKVDEQAERALKDLIIELQGTLLQRLAEAEEDDDINDFSSLISTAKQTRRKAENVLNDLYSRAEQGPTPIATRASTFAEQPPSRAPTVLDQPQRQPTTEETPRGNRISRLFRRSSSTQQDTRTSSVSSPKTAPSSPSITRASTVLTGSPTITRTSTIFSTSPSMRPISLTPITEENKYAGFCKGAWRAQRYELSKAVDLSIRSLERKHHCTKCKFVLPADVRDRNKPCFDDRIYKLNDMWFRLMFLLKSHLPQKSKTTRYGCMLCALAGKPIQQLAGEGHLLEHVLRVHQHQIFGDTQLIGPICIEADTVSSASPKDFDILFDHGDDFALPPSMLGDNQSLSDVPMELPHDIFDNVWATEGS